MASPQKNKKLQQLMINTAMDLIPEKTFQELNQFVSRLTKEQVSLLEQIKNEILLNLPQYQRMKDFRKPVQKVETVFLKKVVHLCQNEQIILKQALVAKLALCLPVLVEKMNLPNSILSLYPDAVERLANFLQSIGLDQYDSTEESFCKDIRFVLGLSIPNGMLICDTKSRIPITSVLLSVCRSKRIAATFRYFLAGGAEPWSRGHIDSRYLTDVNEQGFDNSFFRLAELLKRKKDIKGYVSTSWLHDPKLSQISPHLFYFVKYVGKNGAFLLQHGSDLTDIAMAIKTSETRRRLYEEGKYIPVCYSMLWPRKELIAWAKQYNNRFKQTQ